MPSPNPKNHASRFKTRLWKDGTKLSKRAIAVKLPLEIDELVRSRSDISQFVAIAIIEKLEREGCLPPKSNPLAKNQIGITVNI
jgi:hypothetical protein